MYASYSPNMYPIIPDGEVTVTHSTNGKEKINPASGCLPILIQIPFFFAIYKMLFISLEMRHQPFFGWIKDLSDKDPTSIFNLFGLIPWDPPRRVNNEWERTKRNAQMI